MNIASMMQGMMGPGAGGRINVQMGGPVGAGGQPPQMPDLSGILRQFGLGGGGAPGQPPNLSNILGNLSNIVRDS
jgi:hypothetical protein